MSEAAASFAKAVPLVTVVPLDKLVDHHGKLPIPPEAEARVARKVEQACDIPPSRYFYAGRAHPSFGNFAFAFRPAIEAAHKGSANPFDTGGVYIGKMHPLSGMSDAAAMQVRAQKLIQGTRVDLPAWRSQFAEFLGAFFPAPLGYLTGAAPDVSAPWGPADLPASYKENHGRPTNEWRAWTWEIRLYEEHPVDEHLLGWSCSRGALAQRCRGDTVNLRRTYDLAIRPFFRQITWETFQRDVGEVADAFIENARLQRKAHNQIPPPSPRLANLSRKRPGPPAEVRDLGMQAMSIAKARSAVQ
jgi:hypothetical protein